jgi:hypothetical protein
MGPKEILSAISAQVFDYTHVLTTRIELTVGIGLAVIRLSAETRWNGARVVRVDGANV